MPSPGNRSREVFLLSKEEKEEEGYPPDDSGTQSEGRFPDISGTVGSWGPTDFSEKVTGRRLLRRVLMRLLRSAWVLGLRLGAAGANGIGEGGIPRLVQPPAHGAGHEHEARGGHWWADLDFWSNGP